MDTNTEKSQEPEIKSKLRKSKIIWERALFFLIMHILGLWGLYRALIDRRKWILILYAWSYARLSGWGITIGAHRLFAHRTFKAKPLLKNLLIVAQSMAGQYSLWRWVRDHRQHHQYSDTIYDPHNSKRGFFYSHIGWLMMRADPEVREKRKTVDMSDLEADPLIMLQYKYLLPMYIVLSLVIPILIGYYLIFPSWLDIILMVGVVKQLIVWNFTWLVNSWAHFFGNQPYSTKVVPYDAHLVSMLTDGEGWHNYHHTFPFDYRAGEIWSLNTFYIETAARLGLAYELRTASEEMIARRAASVGDGSREEHLATHGLHPPLQTSSGRQ